MSRACLSPLWRYRAVISLTLREEVFAFRVCCVVTDARQCVSTFRDSIVPRYSPETERNKFNHHSQAIKHSDVRLPYALAAVVYIHTHNEIRLSVRHQRNHAFARIARMYARGKH